MSGHRNDPIIELALAEAERTSQERRKGTQYTLGDLIDSLDVLYPVDDDCNIYLDFGPSPRGLDSWRGSYSELAIEWDDSYEKIRTYGEFLDMLKSAVGKEYQGYKGGWFKMDRDTPLWVSQYGHATSCGIVGIHPHEGASGKIYQIILNTAYVEY